MCPATMRQNASYRYLVAWWSQKPSSCALVPLPQPCCKHGCCNDRGMRQPPSQMWWLECIKVIAFLLLVHSDLVSAAVEVSTSWAWTFLAFNSLACMQIWSLSQVMSSAECCDCIVTPHHAANGWLWVDEKQGTTALERRRIWRFPLLRYSITAENS